MAGPAGSRPIMRWPGRGAWWPPTMARVLRPAAPTGAELARRSGSTRRHHPRQRARRERQRRDHDHVERRGVGRRHPRHRDRDRNNMLGEDDLHPDGFHARPPGHAGGVDDGAVVVVASRDGTSELVLGSGGSKRIRTALAPGDGRRGRPGPGPGRRRGGAAAPLGRRASSRSSPGGRTRRSRPWGQRWPVRRWSRDRDLFCGGVHAVAPGAAAGDPRRGGSAALG